MSVLLLFFFKDSFIIILGLTPAQISLPRCIEIFIHLQISIVQRNSAHVTVPLLHCCSRDHGSHRIVLTGLRLGRVSYNSIRLAYNSLKDDRKTKTAQLTCPSLQMWQQNIIPWGKRGRTSNPSRWEGKRLREQLPLEPASRLVNLCNDGPQGTQHEEGQFLWPETVPPVTLWAPQFARFHYHVYQCRTAHLQSHGIHTQGPPDLVSWQADLMRRKD